MSRRTPDAAAELAYRMRELVDRSGLSVAALAERTGHSRAAWDGYLGGRLAPPAHAVTALADAVGEDPKSLAALWARTRYGMEQGVRRRELPSWARPQSTGRAGEGAGIGPGPEADGQHPHGHRTAVLVATAIGVALIVLAVVLLVAPGDRTHAGAAGKAATPAPRHPSRTTPSETGPPAVAPPAGESAGTSAGAVPPAAVPSSARPPAGSRCAGASCAGHDPEDMGCGGTRAVTVANTTVSGAYVEVRYSRTCGAAWARVTGATVGATLRMNPTGGAAGRKVTTHAGPTAGTFTPMVGAARVGGLRACVTFPSGATGCAAAR